MLSKIDFSNFVGVSRVTTWRWLKRGIIEEGNSGRIDLKAALRSLEEMREARKQRTLSGMLQNLDLSPLKMGRGKEG